MKDNEKRMYDALVLVFQAFEEGWLVAMDSKKLGEFMMLINSVQAAIIVAQGGHRGKVDSDSN